MPATVLMARQPIFNSDLKVVAYELLYRSEEGINPLPLISGDTASSRIILHSYTSIAEAGCLRTLPAFINFSQQMLESDTLPAFAPKDIVIEILEDCQVTPELVAAVRRLRDAGYRLALDDFIYQPEFDPLLKLVQIVKLDILELSAEQVSEQVALIKPFNVTLLAEKVETREEYELCKRLGCTLFQGYFFSKPELMKGHKANGSKIIITQFLAALNGADTDFNELHTLLSRDPALSYKLLRLTNSAAFGLQRSISSLHEAMIYLGLSELRKWASLIIMADDYGKPSELIRQILLKARFCELMAKHTGIDPAEAFLTGLLLHLDALMDQKLAELVSEIELNDEIRDALLHRSGPLGLLLNQVDAFTSGCWPHQEDVHLQQQCYLDSLEWCRESMQLISQL